MKIIGMILVFISSVGIGFSLGYMYKRRITELVEWKKSMINLKNEINFSLTPLPEAFETVGKRFDNYIGKFLLSLSNILSENSGMSMTKLKDEELKELLKDTCLNEKDINNIIEFVKTLGLNDKESQLSTINLHIETIQEEIKNAKKDEEKNSKLFRTLGVLAGIFIIVIFI